VAEHAALLAVLAVGAVLRLAVLVTYPSGLFFSDSWAYLDTAWRNFPVGIAPDRPVGYPLFLHLFGWGHNLGLVFGLQQLAGLGLAAGACFLLVRLGVRKAIAVAVAALICLDGYAIALAQSVMAEPVAVVLTFASFALLVLSDRPRDLAFSGLLLAASVCVRSAVLFAAPVWVAYLVLRTRPSAKSVIASVAALVLPLLLYAGAMDVKYGSFELNASEGWFLYGRVGPIADCAGQSVPASERFLCTDSVQRPDRSADFYIFNPASPPNRHFGSIGPLMERSRVSAANTTLWSFSKRMIVDHPGAYARLAGGDFLRYFEPGVPSHNPASDTVLRLPSDPQPPPTGALRAVQLRTLPHYQPSAGPLAPALSRYARVIHTPRWLLALAALVSLAALPLARGARRRLLPEAWLFSGAALAMLVGSALDAEFVLRYLVPTSPLLLCGGALALEAILQRE
jgi:hypothetical protein